MVVAGQSVGGGRERSEANGGSPVDDWEADGPICCSSSRTAWRTVSRSTSVNPVWACANPAKILQARVKS